MIAYLKKKASDLKFPDALLVAQQDRDVFVSYSVGNKLTFISNKHWLSSQ